MNSSAPTFLYTVASAMIHPAVESGTRSGSVTFKMTPKTASPIRHPVPSSGDGSSQRCMVQPNTDICRVDQDSTVPKHPQLRRRKIEVLFRQRIKIGNTPGNAVPLRIQFASPSLVVPLSLVDEKLEFTSPPFTT